MDSKANACLELYQWMEISSSKPNDYAFTSLLNSCSESGSLSLGRIPHRQIIQVGFGSYTHISNAFISLYCKCGATIDAYHLFEKVLSKDVVSCNSMIAGYAQHGLAIQAISLFEEMKNLGVKPGAVELGFPGTGLCFHPCAIIKSVCQCEVSGSCCQGKEADERERAENITWVQVGLTVYYQCFGGFVVLHAKVMVCT